MVGRRDNKAVVCDALPGHYPIHGVLGRHRREDDAPNRDQHPGTEK